MSERKLRATSTVGEALSFTVGNFGAVMRIGWFPLFLGLASTLGLYAYFYLPLWPELLELFQAALETAGETAGETASETPSEVGGAEKNVAATDKAPSGNGMPSPNPFDDPMLRTMMEMGVGKMSVMYSAAMLIGLLTYSIPSVAYARMVITGATPRGLFYFRLGGRELSVAVVYLVLGVLMYVAIFVTALILMIPILGAIGIGAAGGTDGPGTGLVLALVALVIPGVLFGMAAPLAKFGLAIPIASVKGGLGLGEAWDMSSGHFWSLAWSVVLAVVLVTVIFFVVMIVAMLVMVPFMMAGAGTGGQTAIITMVGLMGVFYVAFYFISYCFSIAFGTAIFAVAYKELCGDGENVPGVEG